MGGERAAGEHRHELRRGGRLDALAGGGEEALDLPDGDSEAGGDLCLAQPVAQQQRDLELACGEP
jgi:hypothetical protein